MMIVNVFSHLCNFIVRSILLLFSTLALIVILIYVYPHPHVDQLARNWPNKTLDVHIPVQAQFLNVSLSNGIHLNVIEGGKQHEKLLMLLHGFPETALITWGHLIDRFIDEGYHVIAPDMRGYNQSSKPQGRASYSMEILATDVQLLITEHAGKQKATVFGVDWGGIVAWQFSQQYPQHLEMFINSILYFNLEKANTQAELRQVAKSWYVFFLQLKGIAEGAISRNDFALLFNVARFDDLGRKGFFSRKLAERFLSSYRDENGNSNLLYPINYYRDYVLNVVMNPKPKESNIQVAVPTLIIYPERDHYVEKELARQTFEQMVAPSIKKHSRYVIIDSSHWMTLEKPDLLFETVRSFLKQQL